MQEAIAHANPPLAEFAARWDFFPSLFRPVVYTWPHALPENRVSALTTPRLTRSHGDRQRTRTLAPVTRVPVQKGLQAGSEIKAD
jgi:hypothetical protein